MIRAFAECLPRLAVLLTACAMPLTASHAGGEPPSAELEPVWPAKAWQTIAPADAGMDAALLDKARDYALSGGGSGMMIRGGRLVYSWGDPAALYDLKSTTKSIGVTALGLAVEDGRLALTDPAKMHYPDFGVPPAGNALTGWLDNLTLLQLATHSAGFDKVGGFTALLFEPGTSWSYSDGGANWLADVLTAEFNTDLAELLSARVFTPIGIDPADLTWRDNGYRDVLLDGVKRREFASGIDADVDAMARIGYLYLRRGDWDGTRILPETFVDEVGRPAPSITGLPALDTAEHANATSHYGLLWWNNGDGSLPGVPTAAYWAWGLHDSLIVVIPSFDLVVARAGDGWRAGWDSDYSVLAPFLQPIVDSVGDAAVQGPTSYPPSSVITGVEWAPLDSVVRAAEGSDNWPLTWADDDALYTAFGDGQGFDGQSGEKLSLGYARVTGAPTAFEGVDIASATGEQQGFGPAGKKSSGMLMVDGMLYQWVRNADGAGEQCQVARSPDHAATWEWSPWTFAEFGYCAFLNFGRNYAGARDGYVYMYTPDAPSAYSAAATAVLTRVPKDCIFEREAYEFFAGLDAAGAALWSTDVGARQPVFGFPGAVNRLDVTYDAPLGRYLLTLRSQKSHDGIDQFSIFEAPEPWGPWATVFYQPTGGEADSDPFDWGESQHIPGKWISEDGREIHLVFSGDDSFSVRRAMLTVAADGSAPAVRIVEPSAGATVASGGVAIVADVSDQSGIKSVAFAANGTSIGLDTAAPYEIVWDAAEAGEGDHEITVTATDASGNQATDAVQVTVDDDAAGARTPSGEAGGGGGSVGVLALLLLLAGVPRGIRTPVAAVKGRCPGPLDDGDADSRGALGWWS